MTLLMLGWHRLLPPDDRHRLPPEQVTDDVIDKIAGPDAIDRNRRRVLSWLLHFGFGAATGSLYMIIADRFSRPAPYTGIGFGLVVWVGSYFGWLRVFDIHGSGRDQSATRNVLMLGVHLAWGVVIGILSRGLMAMRDTQIAEPAIDGAGR